MHPTPCGRFFVLDPLHVGREVLSTLAAWATERHLSVQDAVQLAIVAFTEALDTCATGSESDT
jgi:hypothetical protein